MSGAPAEKRCLTPFFPSVEVQRAHRRPARDPANRLGEELGDAQLPALPARARLLAQRDRVRDDELVEDRRLDPLDRGTGQDRMRDVRDDLDRTPLLQYA